MRGKPTDPLICRAVEILVRYFRPVEIKKILRLPNRTVYDLVDRAKEKRVREEEERKAREEEERRRRKITQATLQPEWQEREKEPVSFVPNARRYHS